MPDERRRPLILATDDSSIIRVMVESVLEEAGYGVVTAGSGEEALEIARSEVPDLVILDLGMPGIGGLGAVRALRKLESENGSRRVPILVLTGSASELDMVEVLELGADDFLAKPFDPSELTTRVRSLAGNPDRLQ